MCLGNRAEVSSHYINSQLGALYDNAAQCTTKHSTGLKPTMSSVEYGTCLYEFYGPGKHSRYQPSRLDLPFFATFGRPRVEFVCNHEVILFLDLQDGHYNLDIAKASPNKHELHESIDPCTIAFRITFSTHAIEKFRCSAIGNSEDYTMILHVLDMESAVFVPELSRIPGITSVTDERSYYTNDRKLTALTYYLATFYLPTLKRAGHHVLYSLPDFDNLSSTSAHIDYSVISKRTLATDSLFGISVDDVNTFLRGLWLQAAAFIDEYGLKMDTVAKSFLAELRTPTTDGIDDMHMHLYFGPLQVQPLCKREVVLYLNIQDIHVYLNGGFDGKPTHQLTDWKIAFIVDIVYEEVDEGSTRRIKLDLATARYCEHLSIFGEYHNVDLLVRIKTTLIRQITTYYLTVLETSETTVIFHHDKRVHVDVDDQSDPESDDEHHGRPKDDDFHVHDCTCPDEASCGHTGGVRWGVLQKRILTHTQPGDFDLVTAVTQGAINAHFKALWDVARRRLSMTPGGKTTWESDLDTCLADFTFSHPEHGDEVFFASSFAPPKVQLVCRDGSYSVIFYLHLVEGFLKTLGSGKSLQPGSHAHQFSHWRLAFEIDLQLIESADETVLETISKRIGQQKPSSLKQLVLDLSTAKFNLSLSTIPGLLDGTDYRTIRVRREALVYYVQTCYFPVFKRAGHQVLYTVPTVKQGVTGNRPHIFTSLRFEIVPFTYAPGAAPLEGLYGRHRAIFERNAVVIVGVTDGRPLPPHALPRGINWTSGTANEVPHGTVCLSRKTFLEARLLTLLERVNRETTIVPSFSGVDGGEWILKLTTWGKHEMKKNSDCKWREITSGEQSLDFEWKNRDEWRYEHEGDFDNNGLYTVNCTTRNILSLPTVRSASSTILVKGTMKLGLSYKGGSKDWSAEMTATWSAGIVLASSASGLQVHLSPAHIAPHFRSSHSTSPAGAPGHATQAQAFAHLQAEFPRSLDFSALVGALRGTLEGTWGGVHARAYELVLAHPVFTRRGDLLLELAVRGAASASVGATHSTALHGRPSVASLNGATAVGMHGQNGNATSEHWFRHVVRKAGDAVQAVVATPGSDANGSATFSRMSSASKVSTVSHQTVTQERAMSVEHRAEVAYSESGSDVDEVEDL
ncbi:hypothetical protein DFH11DRAFT_1803752 [Phellopilus nigrolimitatus]|nr:hypothetical protein DFH11DRAFT_1803752 [Phellopilus nigrolimitatus]